jgi:hypothetical protein
MPDQKRPIMQFNTHLTFVCVAMLLTTAACSPSFYTPKDFKEKTRDHKTVAVLPFEMVMTGRLPETLKPEDIRKIEESESTAFQQSFFSQIHTEHTSAKHPLTVIIQPVETTNEILKDHGLSIRDSWAKSPTELAKMLNVDAIVRSKIVKTRFMSDKESFGLTVGREVLSNLSPIGYYIPTRTNKVGLTTNIYNAKDGDALFSSQLSYSINYNWTPAEAIDRINRQMAFDFPYVKL